MSNEPSANDKFNKHLICQVARTGKFLDFSNGLVAANLDDYAQLTGRGGKDHAAVAVIKADITDYKDKNNTVKCTANVEPYIFEIIYEIAMKNVGTYGIGIGDASNLVSQASGAFNSVGSMFMAMGNYLNGVLESAREMFGGKGLQEIGTKLGTGTKAAVDNLLNYQPVVNAGPVSVNQYADWEHTITRVNTYSLDDKGYAVVREITFRRQQYRKNQTTQEVQSMNAPWYVSISNFKALPLPDGVGYDKKTVLQDSKAMASINISDEEMVEMCYHIRNFVRVWQNAVSLPVLKKGCEIKEQERKAWMDRRDSGSSAV